MTNCVFLETAKRTDKDRHTYFFENPTAIVKATQLDEVQPALHQLNTAVQHGAWIAGIIAYDAGFAFEKKLRHLNIDAATPLLWFGVYDKPKSSDAFLNDDGDCRISEIEFEFQKKKYAECIERIKAYIESGDVYQINFTGKLKFHIEGSARAVYRVLRERQPSPYTAYLDISGTQILSFSPELFFRVQNGRIESKPMKGTAPRGRTAQEDADIAAWLRQSEKNCAENLMILDLIRNDIGRVCNKGSISVPTLFDIEKHPTLFQMTSTVYGDLHPDATLAEIFKSIFPCGSITGAPKIRAMEIIAELEQAPRGLYTGAIGYVSPQKEACFSVAIRTIVVKGNNAEMGIGSGVTWDSGSESEFEECLLKAKFLVEEHEPFSLIESLKYHNGYAFLEEHLARLKSSAAYFDFDYNEDAVRTALNNIAATLDPGRCFKVRLTLANDGTLHLKTSGIEVNQITQSTRGIAVSAIRTNSQEKFFYHKTTRRKLYDDATAYASAHGLADVIFFNERDELAEGAISNVFIEKDGKFFTPPISAGILAGVYRSYVLRSNSNAHEKTLYESDLYEADGIYICNAVRGWIKVELLGDKVLNDRE